MRLPATERRPRTGCAPPRPLPVDRWHRYPDGAAARGTTKAHGVGSPRLAKQPVGARGAARRPEAGARAGTAGRAGTAAAGRRKPIGAWPPGTAPGRPLFQASGPRRQPARGLGEEALSSIQAGLLDVGLDAFGHEVPD